MAESTRQAESTPARRLWLLLFLAAAISIGALRWRAVTPATTLIPPAQRKPAALPALQLLSGAEWTLAAQRGQIVLINYWATWCAPCQEEAPVLNRIAQQQAPRAVSVLGLSLDSGPNAASKVRAFAGRFHLTYPVALSGSAPITSASDIIGIPNTLLIDPAGRLAKVYPGPIDAAVVSRDIQALRDEHQAVVPVPSTSTP